jgi:hypothetical protein
MAPTRRVGKCLPEVSRGFSVRTKVTRGILLGFAISVAVVVVALALLGTGLEDLRVFNF